MGLKVAVVAPPRPILSVVHGSVQMGLNRKYVSSRCMPRTYGIKCGTPEETIREEYPSISEAFIREHKYRSAADGEMWVNGIFSPFVHRSQNVKLEEVEHLSLSPLPYPSFAHTSFLSRAQPVTRCYQLAGDGSCDIIILNSMKEKPETFEQGKELGRFEFSLPDGKAGDTIIVKFFFGDTTIKIKASWDKAGQTVEKDIRLQYMFL